MKRKLPTRPDGMVVVPYHDFDQFKLDHPDIITPPVFVRNATAIGIFAELVRPTTFKNRDVDYFITTPEIPDGDYTWNTKSFTVKGTELWHLGSIVCEDCFILGRLEPRHGCREHNIR